MPAEPFQTTGWPIPFQSSQCVASQRSAAFGRIDCRPGGTGWPVSAAKCLYKRVERSVAVNTEDLVERALLSEPPATAVAGGESDAGAIGAD